MVLPVVLSVVLLVWSVVANLVIGETGYVPRNLAATGLLLLVAWKAQLRPGELGLARAKVTSGLRWGAVAVAVVAAVLTIGLLLGDAIGPLAGLFDDERANMGAGAVATNALLRIPLGTVVFEEVAFRGVLLAAFARVCSTRSAMLWSAAVFGVWHIPPTMASLDVNGMSALTGSGVLAVVGGVVITAVGGWLFAWLRVRSGSLLAPMLAHVATNSLGLTAAAVS